MKKEEIKKDKIIELKEILKGTKSIKELREMNNEDV